LVRVTLIFMLVAACAGEESSVPFELCRKDVNFLWRVGAADGRVDPMQQLLFEPGLPLLAITEDCRFITYVLSSDGYPPVAREGVLSADRAEQLSRDLDLARVFGEGGTFRGDTFDGPTVEFFSEGVEARCLSGCGGSAVLDAATRAAASWAQLLRDEGLPIEAGLRVTVVRDPPVPPGVAAVAWPLDVSIASLAVPYADIAPYTSPVFSDSELTAPLRTLWKSFDAGEHGLWAYQFLPFDEAGEVDDVADYGVVVRDVLPMEDERGHVNFPW
jgi:hypothetical protein